MPFPFNPPDDPPTADVTNPPISMEDYAYYDGATTFESNATGYSRINAWFLAETSLLAYLPLAEIKKVFESPILGFKPSTLGEADSIGCFPCVLLEKEDTVIVAFRGTQVPGFRDPLAFLKTFTPSLNDVLMDVDVIPEPFNPGKVHAGFLGAYRDVAGDLTQLLKDRVNRKSPKAIWFTGHSAGGAMATIAAARFGATGKFQGLYTYGCPMVGDVDFLTSLEDKPYFRFIHSHDFAAHFPPSVPGYVQGGHFVFIDQSGAVDTEAKADGDGSNAQDSLLVFPSAALSAAEATVGFFLGKPDPLTVPFKPNPVTDHGPIYYTIYLKRDI